MRQTQICRGQRLSGDDRVFSQYAWSSGFAPPHHHHIQLAQWLTSVILPVRKQRQQDQQSESTHCIMSSSQSGLYMRTSINQNKKTKSMWNCTLMMFSKIEYICIVSLTLMDMFKGLKMQIFFKRLSFTRQSRLAFNQRSSCQHYIGMCYYAWLLLNSASNQNPIIMN